MSRKLFQEDASALLEEDEQPEAAIQRLKSLYVQLSQAHQKLHNERLFLYSCRQEMDRSLEVLKIPVGEECLVEVADALYIKKKTARRLLFLGSGVFCETTADEGHTLLAQRREELAQTLQKLEEGAEQIQRNMTTVQVNTARLHNLRQLTGETSLTNQ